MNDASHDVQEAVGPFHNGNNHDNYRGMNVVADMSDEVAVDMFHPDTSQVGTHLADNNHVGGMVDEVQQAVDVPAWTDVAI